MRNRLTIRQEKFCNFYLESGNASEAYRRAYPNSEKWSNKSVWNRANRVLNNAEVLRRVDELKRAQSEKNEIRRDEILKLCADVMRGANITDVMELSPSGKRARTLSKSWAIERICRMLGYDAPMEVKARITGTTLTREEMEDEIRRIRKARGEE